MKKSSLLDEFLATNPKSNKCSVCAETTPEVRKFIESARGKPGGPQQIVRFLRKKGLWRWTERPIRTHWEHTT